MTEDELDQLDERVMLAHGWQKLPYPAMPKFQRPTPNGVECQHHVNRYSRDWRAAGDLVEEMRAAGWTVQIQVFDDGECQVLLNKWEDAPGGFGGKWVCHFMGRANSAPEAICRAYLAWKEIQPKGA